MKLGPLLFCVLDPPLTPPPLDSYNYVATPIRPGDPISHKAIIRRYRGGALLAISTGADLWTVHKVVRACLASSPSPSIHAYTPGSSPLPSIHAYQGLISGFVLFVNCKGPAPFIIDESSPSPFVLRYWFVSVSLKNPPKSENPQNVDDDVVRLSSISNPSQSEHCVDWIPVCARWRQGFWIS
ncbi:unnamed protein product [Linum trigynum]|uniref:Uncharacterized protein n=1 Tax=Linum trigynum TaxID=586398 RepID=A0AAV2FNM4_9ROSI